jgi:hypothetical protein
MLDSQFGAFISSAISSQSLAARCFSIVFDISPAHQQIPPVHTDTWRLYAQTACTICYASEQGLFFVYKNKAKFWIDFSHHQGRGYLVAPYTQPELRHIYRNILLVSIFHELVRQNTFLLHASGIAQGEQGIIIAGASGRGKTTLLLHLLQQGGKYMGDDILLLREHQKTPQILSLPTPIRITPLTAQYFPELNQLLEPASPDEQGKYNIDITELPHVRLARTARPTLLLLPEIRPDQKQSSCLQISRVQAALQYLPDNMIEGNAVGHNNTEKQNFHLLMQVIQQVRCYRIYLGEEMTTIGQQIMALLDER